MSDKCFLCRSPLQVGLVSSRFIARLLNPLSGECCHFLLVPQLLPPPFGITTAYHSHSPRLPASPRALPHGPRRWKTSSLTHLWHLSPTHSPSEAHLFWEGSSEMIFMTNLGSPESTCWDHLSSIRRRSMLPSPPETQPPPFCMSLSLDCWANINYQLERQRPNPWEYVMGSVSLVREEQT